MISDVLSQRGQYSSIKYFHCAIGWQVVRGREDITDAKDSTDNLEVLGCELRFIAGQQL